MASGVTFAGVDAYIQEISKGRSMVGAVVIFQWAWASGYAAAQFA